MKKLNKFFLTVCTVSCCLFGMSVESKAQPDPFLLAQQIAQWAQDQDIGGFFEIVTSAEADVEQYNNLIEKIDDFKRVAELIQQTVGGSQKLITEVISATEVTINTFETIKDYRDYFSTSDLSSSYAYLQNLDGIRSGYMNIIDGLELDFNELLKNIKEFKRGDSTSLLQLAGDFAEKYNTQVIQLSQITTERCLATYQKSCRDQEAEAGKKMLKTFIY